MLERLPADMRTPAVARAVTLPSAILLAGVGASATILAGAPLAAAAVVGGLCWAGRVALALPRRKRRDINPAVVREPWRSLVRRAMDAERRFTAAVEGTEPGPLRDRLSEVARRVAVGVDESWLIAKRGDALDRAVASLDTAGIERRLALREAEVGAGGRRRHEDPIIESLRNQLESARRLEGVAADARDRLRRLEAQLNEAVARAVELSLSAPDAGALQPLGTDVDTLVGELESLRLALDETAGATG